MLLDGGGVHELAELIGLAPATLFWEACCGQSDYQCGQTIWIAGVRTAPFHPSSECGESFVEDIWAQAQHGFKRCWSSVCGQTMRGSSSGSRILQVSSRVGPTDLARGLGGPSHATGAAPPTMGRASRTIAGFTLAARWQRFCCWQPRRAARSMIVVRGPLSSIMRTTKPRLCGQRRMWERTPALRTGGGNSGVLGKPQTGSSSCGRSGGPVAQPRDVDQGKGGGKGGKGNRHEFSSEGNWEDKSRTPRRDKGKKGDGKGKTVSHRDDLGAGAPEV